MEIQRYSPQSRRRSSAEQRQIVEQFQRSGLTRAAFSEQFGIPLATLGWYLAKAKHAASSQPAASVAFSEIKLVTSAPAESSTWAMEVESPSGMVVRCRVALGIRDLARLLRG